MESNAAAGAGGASNNGGGNNFVSGGYELTASNAIMPSRGTGGLRIMPVQGEYEHRSRGGGSSHENCEADILRMERRLKDFDTVVKTLHEKHQYQQAQVNMLIEELKQYKERDR